VQAIDFLRKGSYAPDRADVTVLGEGNATVIRGFSLFFIGKYTLVIQCRLVHSEYISQLGNEARHNASRSHWFNDFIHIKKITFK
jgi:hypothetical protein